MENNKKRRAVELLKDVLIVFLTLSALWLAAQTPLAAPFRVLLREEGRQTAPGQGQEVDRRSGAIPMAMVDIIHGETGMTLGVPDRDDGLGFGLQYI